MKEMPISIAVFYKFEKLLALLIMSIVNFSHKNMGSCP